MSGHQNTLQSHDKCPVSIIYGWMNGESQRTRSMSPWYWLVLVFIIFYTYFCLVGFYYQLATHIPTVNKGLNKKKCIK